MSNLLLPIFLWSAALALAAGTVAHFALRNRRRAVVTAGIAIVVAPACFTAWLYLNMPSFTGIFWGHGQMMVAAALVSGLVAGINAVVASFSRAKPQDRWGGASRNADDNGELAFWLIAGTGVVWLVIALVGWASTYAFMSFGAAKARSWAELASVRVASEDEKLPRTNPDRIQMVTRGYAHFRGQQKITDGGQELSSFYAVRMEDWVRLAVGDKTYWVAPLVPASDWRQFWGAVEDSPGFISVDAEDPNGEVKVHSGHTIKMFPGGWWDRNLRRYVYMRGYTRGVLDDPGLEVDEAWQPFYTMTYTEPKFVIGGQVVRKILVVNANSGQISEYDVDQVPVWIERVMSDELLTEYVHSWGLWNDQRARDNWPNFGSAYQQKMADLDLVFNQSHEAVWSIPMTSLHARDSAGTGLLLYSTRENRGVFYPGLKGIGVGESVARVFENCPANIRKYPVRQVQLYAVHGVPTYVGIFVQDQGAHGESFAAIGMLDARDMNGANVVYALDKASALSQYANYIANGRSNSGDVNEEAKPSKPVAGVIERIGWMLENGQTIFTFAVEGDSRLFTATLTVSRELPIVRDGDEVEFTYVDTGAPVLAVRSFKVLKRASGRLR